MSEFHSFLRLNNIQLYAYRIFYLFVYSSMDIWVVSTFWPLQIMLLLMGVYNLTPFKMTFSLWNSHVSRWDVSHCIFFLPRQSMHKCFPLGPSLPSSLDLPFLSSLHLPSIKKTPPKYLKLKSIQGYLTHRKDMGLC